MDYCVMLVTGHVVDDTVNNSAREVQSEDKIVIEEDLTSCTSANLGLG